ncbi:MAG: DUF308 domain-containing protein [Lachnospiraceae bacterium]|nr:DUF308 domain-containing protein [Lachnospiraceae bacterium]
MMKNKAVKNNNENQNVVGNVAVIFFAALMIAMGAILYNFKKIDIEYFAYAIAVCLLVWGIWLISRYFMRKEYLHTTNYGFSAGVLLVIAGVLSFIEYKVLADFISDYMVFSILLMGIFMLQNAVQTKNVEGKLWFINLILSIAACVASLLLYFDVNDVMTDYPLTLYFVMMVTGAAGLISLSMAGIRTYMYHKKTSIRMKRDIKDCEDWFAEDDVVFPEDEEGFDVADDVEEDMFV